MPNVDRFFYQFFEPFNRSLYANGFISIAIYSPKLGMAQLAGLSVCGEVKLISEFD